MKAWIQEKWGILVDEWKKLRALHELRAQAQVAEQELAQVRSVLADTKAERDLANEKLAQAERDPLAEANRLLEHARDIIECRSNRQQYVIMGWLAEYREYRTRKDHRLGGRV